MVCVIKHIPAPELRPGYLVLNDSSIFLDMEGGSLAKSFSVVEGKYNLPDLVANCLKSSKNDHKFLVSSQVIMYKSLNALSCSSVEPQYGSSSKINCLACDVIFFGSYVIASRAEYASGNTVRHYSHLDITSDHRPGSAGNTSITPDSVHAGGRVHCQTISLVILKEKEKYSVEDMVSITTHSGLYHRHGQNKE
ncbi:hypothetical protein Tco_1047245 [Tanacetum coccineum]